MVMEVPVGTGTLWTRVIKSIHGMSKNKWNASYKLRLLTGALGKHLVIFYPRFQSTFW